MSNGIQRRFYNHKADLTKKLERDKFVQDLSLQLDDIVGAINSAPSTSIFSKEFISAETTIVSSSNVFAAHGLGVMPKLIQVRIICKTPEYGFSAGDEAIPWTANTSLDANIGVVGYCDSVNVGASLNGFQYVMRKDTNDKAVITLANWKLIFRAWA